VYVIQECKPCVLRVQESNSTVHIYSLCSGTLSAFSVWKLSAHACAVTSHNTTFIHIMATFVSGEEICGFVSLSGIGIMRLV
jgi:hypothetical protein